MIINGTKNTINRHYCIFVTNLLKIKFILTDYFYSLCKSLKTILILTFSNERLEAKNKTFRRISGHK